MQYTDRTAPLSALVTTPLNVRRKDAGDEKIAQIAASIAARGLISPLVVHALTKPKGKFGVIAGQQRLRALTKLQADGAAFDFDNITIRVAKGTDAELTELSLAENRDREQMRPSEIYAAFRDIKERDPDVTDEDLAKRFGLDGARYQRIMRLAFLHPTVFAAYDAGDLKDEQAFAFAATADQELQLQVYTGLWAKGDNWQRSPSHIRAAMKVGNQDHRAMLKLVGRDVYEGEGGRFEADLFAQAEGDGRVLDEDTLVRLVNIKLEEARAATIAEHAETGTITFVDEPPKDKYGSSYDFRIYPRPTDFTEEQRARLDVIGTREQEIQDLFDANPDWCDDDGDIKPEATDALALDAEADRLAAEEREIHANQPKKLPKGDKLATIRLGPDGQPQIDFYTEKKLRGSGSAGATGPKPEVSDKAAATLRQMRSNMFGRFLFETFPAANDNRMMAQDALIYSMAIAILRRKSSAAYGEYSNDGLGLVTSFGGAVYEDYGDEPPFAPDLADIPGLDATDIVTGFSDYCYRATDEQKGRLAAFVYFRKVRGLLYAEGRRSIPEYIAVALSQPMMARRAWTPTARFFGLFRKDKTLDWIGAIDANFRAIFAKMKAGDLKANAADFFVGGAEAGQRYGFGTMNRPMVNWLPEWLRWNAQVTLVTADPAPPADADAAAADDAELDEAAE